MRFGRLVGDLNTTAEMGVYIDVVAGVTCEYLFLMKFTIRHILECDLLHARMISRVPKLRMVEILNDEETARHHLWFYDLCQCVYRVSTSLFPKIRAFDRQEL